MAEIRKHQRTGSGLAAAVRAAIGDDVRPVPVGQIDSEPVETQSDPDPVPGTASLPFLTAGTLSFLQPVEPMGTTDTEDPVD